MGAFKSYDIRGIWGKDIDEELSYKIGYFIPSLLSASEVIVGRDMRLSSPLLHQHLIEGILDSGASVIDLGLTTTPMVYFANVHYKAKCSLMITASHNGKEYNGIKVSGENSFPISYEMGLGKLEELTKNGTIEKKERGRFSDKSREIREEYISFLKSYLPDLKGMKIAIDSSNGMASTIVHEIFGERDCIYINDTLDGSFPSHDPNPLIEKNLDELKRTVRENNMDLGLIFDGDADRVVFVSEEGKMVQPDYMTAVLGLYYKSKNRLGKAVLDIRTSNSTIEFLEENGFTPILWKVGHAYASEKIIEEKAVFGGELAGHYYLMDEFFGSDAAILTSLLMLTAIKENGGKLSAILEKIIRYENSGEVNFSVKDKDGIIDHLFQYYKKQGPERILSFDGYRMEFPSWWFNVRKSNTEPLLRIVIEAKNRELLEEKRNEIENMIRSF